MRDTSDQRFRNDRTGRFQHVPMQQRRPRPARPDDINAKGGLSPDQWATSDTKLVAQGREQLQNEFLAVLSHELRDPLATIKGFVDLLIGDDTGNLTGQQREFLAIVADNARRQVEFVDQVLEFADIRTGRAPLNGALVDMRELVEHWAGANGAPPADQTATVTLGYEGSVPQVLGDSDRICQILNVLVDHARQRDPNGGPIDIAVLTEDRSLYVEVRDRGPAMTPTERDQLFAGFHRLTRSGSDLTSSLGLHLPIARALARLQGGDLVVLQSHERGTTLCLTLPLSPPTIGSASAS
jgi:two-component system, NtrC family, sensor histidine kinase KinB